MMFPINIPPEVAAKEVMDFNKKLAEGLENLQGMDHISTGVTPKEIVHQEDKLVLFRYKGEKKPTSKVPLLIIYALVNRPYMADIQENRSTIKGLLEAGQDVYLIDWGYPDRADRYLTLDDYINTYIDNCVDFICKSHKLKKINILGICQGGTFSLCYSSLHPDKVKNLVTMVTPVDFQTPDNMLSAWVQQMDIDLLVDTMGNVPGDLLNWMFLSLKPFQLMGQKYLSMVDVLKDEDKAKSFMRMEKWIFDSPDQAGEAFRQFNKDFYQQNKLIKGEVQIGDDMVNLNNLKMPVFNIYATEDHLVPPDASRALKKCVGTDDYSELTFAGGHIGIYVSGKAQKQVPPAIGEWLDAR